MDYMIYIGDGSALHDVPARNLNRLEADRFGVEALLASGLYVLADPPTPVKPKKQVAEQPAKDGE